MNFIQYFQMTSVSGKVKKEDEPDYKLDLLI